MISIASATSLTLTRTQLPHMLAMRCSVAGLRVGRTARGSVAGRAARIHARLGAIAPRLWHDVLEIAISTSLQTYASRFTKRADCFIGDSVAYEYDAAPSGVVQMLRQNCATHGQYFASEGTRQQHT